MTDLETAIPSMRLRRAVALAGLVFLVELAVSAWGWATIPAGTQIPTQIGRAHV